MKKNIILAFLILFFLKVHSQNINADTLLIHFSPDTLIPVNFTVDEVSDNRPDNSRFISYSQTKKFLLLPVDQEITTRTPLHKEIKNSFDTVSSGSLSYSIGINYFLIEKYKGKFFSPYVLRADIALYLSDTTRTFLGTLSYNTEYKPPFRKTPKTEVCETMLLNWHRELKLDLLKMAPYIKSGTKKPENLISQNVKSHFFNIRLATAIGPGFWQAEGELYFTRPENNSNQWFISNIIRYQNTKDFELIAFGSKSEHFQKRLNSGFSLDISSNVLIGFNKWKNKSDKTLYQLLNFSVSSSQSIGFDKANLSGWILKTGLFENFYYIVDTPLRLQIGVYLSGGYKF